MYEGPKIAYIEKCNSNCIVLYSMYLYVCTILQTCFIIGDTEIVVWWNYGNSNIFWSPSVVECEHVLSRLTKQQTGKEWSISLRLSCHESIVVTTNNLNKVQWRHLL